MKNIKCLSLLFFLLFLLGCVDDDSRYGDIEIDEITIEGIEEYREIEFGGRLTITPTVKTKFGEKSDLSYVWYKYNQKQVVADTLSFEKNLDVTIADALPGDEITLSFKVIDNRTGVYQLHNSKFKTVGVYAGGTLMLCRNDGQYDLSMLKKDGVTFYENIYSLANNGEKLGDKSKRLFLTHSYAKNPLATKAVIVACDDHSGGVYLDSDALIRKNYMREKFMFHTDEELPGDLVITGVCNGQSTEYMIVNGKVHGRTFSGSEAINWESEYVILSEPSDYEMAPFVTQPFDNDNWGGPYYGNPIFYDNLHGRFMINETGGYFSFLGGKLNDFSQFNPNHIGENIHLVATGCVEDNLNKAWALLKNTETGEYLLIKYEIVMDEKWNNGFISSFKQTLSSGSCPGMYGAETFVPGNKYAISTSNMWEQHVEGLSNICFYLSGNKVYAFNTQSYSEGVIIDGDKEGYTITGLDCKEVPSPTAEKPDATRIQLTLCVQDRGVTDKQGGIAVYQLNQIGGLSARKLYAKAGFCDEVVCTIEKQD